MHTFLTLVGGASGAGVVFCFGYVMGGRVQSAVIRDSLKNDRGVAIALLEDLALRWGVKIEHQETPGAGT